MPDREKVIERIHEAIDTGVCVDLFMDVLELLKEPEAVVPNTIPEELKLKMWNALYAKEDEFEKKYIRTKEQNSWFLIYRSWLQEGFNLAIKAIADWEGG